jgi:hypothetical protein
MTDVQADVSTEPEALSDTDKAELASQIHEFMDHIYEQAPEGSEPWTDDEKSRVVETVTTTIETRTVGEVFAISEVLQSMVFSRMDADIEEALAELEADGLVEQVDGEQGEQPVLN